MVAMVAHDASGTLSESKEEQVAERGEVDKSSGLAAEPRAKRTDSKIITFPSKADRDLELTRPTNGTATEPSPELAEDYFRTGFVETRERITRRQPSEQYLQIMRAHFVEQILKDLERVQQHALTSGAAMYINQVLRLVRQMDDLAPEDPFLDVLYALYDALAYEGQWATYEAEQYARVHDVLSKYSVRRAIKTSDIEKAVIDLEDIGLDTTPYPLEIHND